MIYKYVTQIAGIAIRTVFQRFGTVVYIWRYLHGANHLNFSVISLITSAVVPTNHSVLCVNQTLSISRVVNCGLYILNQSK